MKIVVDKVPEEGIDCMFHRKKIYQDSSVVECGIDGCLCTLECLDYCEKLITLGELTSGCD